VVGNPSGISRKVQRAAGQILLVKNNPGIKISDQSLQEIEVIKMYMFAMMVY
jgi:hypothetical protein